MTVYGIMAVAVIASVLVLTVKQIRPELAMLAAIGAGVAILAAILIKLSPIVEDLLSLANASGIKSEYFAIMLKALAICYLTQFAEDICKDFGQSSLASKVQLCGRVALAAISMPLMISYIEMLKKLVE